MNVVDPFSYWIHCHLHHLATINVIDYIDYIYWYIDAYAITIYAIELYCLDYITYLILIFTLRFW